MNRIIMAPFKFVDAVFDRVLAAAGALAMAQFPQFFIQYLQRLGGHVDELALVVAGYRASAKSSGKTLNEFIQMHLQSKVVDFHNSGLLMQSSLERFESISQAKADLSSATIYNKLLLFIRHLDTDMASATLKDFVPGIPLTVEAAVYAGIGLVFALALYSGCKKALQMGGRGIAGKLKGKSRRSYKASNPSL